MRKFYPINLDIQNKNCVVVGGGKVAFRKICGLLKAGANVKIVSPQVCEEVKKLVKLNSVSWICKEFSPEIIEDEIILIAASNDMKVNYQAAQAAMEKKMLVNVIDQEGGNFNVPSTINYENLLLTISTGATSPAFSKFVREMLESELNENFSKGLKIVANYRKKSKKLLTDYRMRQDFWRRALTREVWNILKTGEFEKLEVMFEDALKSFRLESQDSANRDS